MKGVKTGRHYRSDGGENPPPEAKQQQQENKNEFNLHGANHVLKLNTEQQLFTVE